MEGLYSFNNSGQMKKRSSGRKGGGVMERRKESPRAEC